MYLLKRMTCVGSQWKRGEQNTDSESQARLMNDLYGSSSDHLFFFLLLFFFLNEAGLS